MQIIFSPGRAGGGGAQCLDSEATEIDGAVTGAGEAVTQVPPVPAQHANQLTESLEFGQLAVHLPYLLHSASLHVHTA
jgi:hypothetical protein